MQILDGSAIKGSDGIDIFPRRDGYYVEHFSIADEKTLIVWTAGPFEDRGHARHVCKVYREIWSNPNA